MNKAKQQGFTLIELIIVIIILGILAVTAAPKFIDVQSDARRSTVEGLQGAVKGAANLTFAKAAIAGVEKDDAADDSDVSIDGATVDVLFGYPEDAAALQNVVDTGEGDFTFVDGDANATTPAVGSVGVSPNGTTADFAEIGTSGSSCHLTYTPPTAAGSSPTVAIVTGNC